MDIDPLARAMAYASALTIAKMAAMLAANGQLSESNIEELRVIATEPFDWTQLGQRQPPAHMLPELEKARELIDTLWNDACLVAQRQGDGGQNPQS